MTLEWQDKRTDDRGYQSRCNRYRVDSIDKDGREVWQVWKLVPGGNWFAPLTRPDLDEASARAAAEADAQARVA